MILFINASLIKSSYILNSEFVLFLTSRIHSHNEKYKEYILSLFFYSFYDSISLSLFRVRMHIIQNFSLCGVFFFLSTLIIVTVFFLKNSVFLCFTIACTPSSVVSTAKYQKRKLLNLLKQKKKCVF